jgi:hypothetical protein
MSTTCRNRSRKHPTNLPIRIPLEPFSAACVHPNAGSDNPTPGVWQEWFESTADRARGEKYRCGGRFESDSIILHGASAGRDVDSGFSSSSGSSERARTIPSRNGTIGPGRCFADRQYRANRCCAKSGSAKSGFAKSGSVANNHNHNHRWTILPARCAEATGQPFNSK